MPSPLEEYRGAGSKKADLVEIRPHCLKCLSNCAKSSLIRVWPTRRAAVAKEFMIPGFTVGS